jgi:hypothetical protein
VGTERVGASASAVEEGDGVGEGVELSVEERAFARAAPEALGCTCNIFREGYDETKYNNTIKAALLT